MSERKTTTAETATIRQMVAAFTQFFLKELRVYHKTLRIYPSQKTNVTAARIAIGGVI